MFFSSLTIKPRKGLAFAGRQHSRGRGKGPSRADPPQPWRRFEVLSVRKSYQGRFGPLLRRRAGYIHHHRKQRVVPVDPNQVNDALVAKFCQYFGIRRVANRLVMVQFDAEIVDGRFFVRQTGGASSLSKKST